MSFFALYSILIFSVEMALHWYFLLFPSWLDLPGRNPVPAFFSILLRGPLVPRNCLQSLPTLIRILFLSRRCASGRQSGLAGCLSTWHNIFCQSWNRRKLWTWAVPWVVWIQRHSKELKIAWWWEERPGRFPLRKELSLLSSPDSRKTVSLAPGPRGATVQSDSGGLSCALHVVFVPPQP